jgi:pimeloyl-ACP methyl ester carboxylesterase
MLPLKQPLPGGNFVAFICKHASFTFLKSNMKKATIWLMLAIVTGCCIAGCSMKDDNPFYKPKTFVLVHGAWQAPYVWEAVKKELELKGQKVVVVELPAHGNDTTSPATVSVDVYANTVIAAINGIKGKVILVGHSMGGVVVSSVAEKIPERIQKLIYIGAFVPSNGQSLLDLASQDKQSHLGPNLIPSKDQLTLDVVHDSIVSIFCQDAPKNVQQLVLYRYRAEPAIAFTNKVTLTAANFGKVDKYYIHTLMDHAIGADLQNQMVAAAKITKLYSINTGHCPFLSQPDEVTRLLLTISR